jgi:hypothetical protein
VAVDSNVGFVAFAGDRQTNFPTSRADPSPDGITSMIFEFFIHEVLELL